MKRGSASAALATAYLATAWLTAGTAFADPLTEDECRAIWNTAAGRSDLSADGAKPYIDDFASVDANRDMKINNAEFKAGCKAGLVHKFRRPEGAK